MAVNIQFKTGTYKEYQLNGKETIRVCVSDPNIIDRIKGIDARIDEVRKKYGDNVTVDNLGALDKEIRKIVDDVIDCPGACDKAFGGINCLSMSGGQPIIFNFVNALMEQLKDDIVEAASDEVPAEKVRLDGDALDRLENERTIKYIKAFKEAADRDDEARGQNRINIAALSQEERERLMRELLEGQQ